MAHGQYAFTGKTIRFNKTNASRHDNAIPYTRKEKHKASTYEEYK
jgi:hypothetical protein